MKLSLILFLTFLLYSCVPKEEPVTKSRMWHYDNRNLKSQVFFKSGKRDSISTSFFKNGIVKEQMNYFNGIPFGNQYNFDSLGNLTLYYFNSLEGKTLFYIDSVEVKGNPIYYVYNKNEVKLGEVYQSLIYLAVPKNFNYTLNVTEINNQEKARRYDENELESFYKKLPYAHVYSIDRKFESKGKYSIHLKTILYDPEGTQVSIDSSLFVVNVR